MDENQAKSVVEGIVETSRSMSQVVVELRARVRPTEKLTAEETADAIFAAKTHVLKGTLLSDQSISLIARYALERSEAFDLKTHLERAREFSERTFGPGERTFGIVDHIQKELVEICAAHRPSSSASPNQLLLDGESAPLPHVEEATEWIDVVILAFDALWRLGMSPLLVIALLQAKQSKNEQRKWPDWRTAAPGKAIEHIRDDEAP